MSHDDRADMTMTLKLVVVRCCANAKVVAWNVLISELGEAPWWLELVLLHARLKNDRKVFFSPPSKPSSQCGSDVFFVAESMEIRGEASTV